MHDLRLRISAGVIALAGSPACAFAQPLVGAIAADSPVPAAEATAVTAGEDRSLPAPEPRGKTDSKRDFSFVVSPYLWLPVVDGKVGGSEPGAISFTIDTGDLLEAFESGGLIHGEVRHKSGWGLSVDYMFADLSTSSDVGVTLDTAVDAGILEATVLRRVELGNHALDLYGGIRRWDSDVVVDVQLGPIPVQILTGDTWTDPIAGARYHHALSDRWQLQVQGDVGGFGLDSDFAWHAVAGVNYAAGRRVTLNIAYKRLSVERQSPRIGGGPPVDLDLTVQGPLVGFAWRF